MGRFNSPGWVFLCIVCLAVLSTAAMWLTIHVSEHQVWCSVLATLTLLLVYFTFRTGEGACESEDHPLSKYAGVMSLLMVSVGFLVVDYITQSAYYRNLLAAKMQRKRSATGILLVMGASAILFGFLDNYGMKLGCDALETEFFKPAALSFLMPAKYGYEPHIGAEFSDNLTSDDIKHGFELYDALEDNAKKNLWRNVVEIQMAAQTAQAAQTAPSQTAASQRYRSNAGGVDEKKIASIADAYAKIAKGRDDALSMMGNTFSDFVGAMLGAGIGKLFQYLTAVDGDIEGVDIGYRILQNSTVKIVMEAFFIAVGCMIPIGLHVGRVRSNLYGNASKDKKDWAWMLPYNSGKGSKRIRPFFFLSGERREGMNPLTYQTFVSSMVLTVVALIFFTNLPQPCTEGNETVMINSRGQIVDASGTPVLDAQENLIMAMAVSTSDSGVRTRTPVTTLGVGEVVVAEGLGASRTVKIVNPTVPGFTPVELSIPTPAEQQTLAGRVRTGETGNPCPPQFYVDDKRDISAVFLAAVGSVIAIAMFMLASRCPGSDELEVHEDLKPVDALENAKKYLIEKMKGSTVVEAQTS